MAAEVSASELRAWARANGHTVSTRGRIPDDVRAAYEKAHATAPRRRRSAGDDRLAALEREVARLRAVEERVLALEDQVDSLTARLAEAAGTRRRSRFRRG